MADNTTDDVYSDPDNILADTDDSIDGAVELPTEQTNDLSQSIYTPEKTAPGDDRPDIPELAAADDGESQDGMSQSNPEDSDGDSNHLGDVNPSDEQDGTER